MSIKAGKAEHGEKAAGQEKQPSQDPQRTSVAVQCGSEKSFEDSNIVLVKSWSDNEDDQEGDKLAENKKLRRREKRELKRKLLAESAEDEVAQKKTKIEEKRTALKVDKSQEMSENASSEIKSEDLMADGSGPDTAKKIISSDALKQSRPGYSDDRFSETTYYFDKGLRKVYPYYFTFTTFTKGRWVGDTVLDVFSREFRAHPSHEYKRCIEAGSLTVNHEKVAVDYKLKHNDLLANVVHRHEVPVVASPIEVVHIDKDVVVINKPASIPVHPCGRYRHNTIVFILAKEYNLKNLRTIHRLDRLTSGMLMFGRTVRKALELEEQIRNRQVHKEYVCRVEGNFPFDEIECTKPIEVVSYKIGVCKVSPKGKECSTTFKKIGYNPKTNISVVRCMPHTGRMHQIRVHLQYLGYPVLRDPLYNHPVFGPEKGKGGNIGKTDDQLIKDLIHIHNAENWLGIDGSDSAGVVSISPMETPVPIDDRNESECVSEAPIVPTTEDEKFTFKSVATQTNHDEPDPHFCKEKLTKEPTCSECNVQYRDPKPMDLIMYLHALRYEGPNWSYETSLPPWADVNWTED
ncbi:RNA pseudouridylate synthase domain-containing protein 2 [Frankliniella fusca]|uniref:Pseudouridylate synthase RPUSD2 n=1 Tax=Frankliniella fusca TaxID=407009 RepID=A0AAE1HFP8_9NEOP|nr:RNA pseudouridylate synthase domain-containing protein 2 [Frankliniella fusca]